MKVLVTGAGGMVGSHMVEILNNEGEDVLGTYYKPTTDLKEISTSIHMQEMDVRYYQGVLRVISSFKPDCIYHLAAQSYPTVSWIHPQATMETNINGTINVFEAIKSVRKSDSFYDPMVVVACSSAEYGQTLEELPENNPYVLETAELRPLHPYGVSKVGQDLLSFQYFANDHIRCVRARIFNSTGTRKVNDVTSEFTYRAVMAEKTGIYEIRVGNLHSQRAIMDQCDLIRGLRLLAEKGKPGDVYNLSSENIYAIKDIIKMIENQIGHELHITVDTQLLRPTDEKIIVGNVKKLKDDTGWKQEISMEQTVKDMIEYWRHKL